MKITISLMEGDKVNLTGGLSELGEDFKLAIVRRVFEREYQTCESKSHAVLNTAIILDVDERYVWRLLKKWENKNVPNIEAD
jgi:hypothetical protein